MGGQQYRPPNAIILIMRTPNPYNPLYNPSFHFIFHFLFHLILHYCGYYTNFGKPANIEVSGGGDHVPLLVEGLGFGVQGLRVGFRVLGF